MKNLITLVLVCLPLFCLAQKKESWIQRRRDADRREAAAWNVTKAKAIQSPGLHLQKASSFMLGGVIAEIGGAALIGYGSSSSGSCGAIYAGAGFAGLGLILQVIGITQIGKAGKIMMSGKGVAVTF